MVRHRLPDAKRRDAIHDLGLDAFDLTADFFDERIHIPPPPVVATERDTFYAARNRHLCRGSQIFVVILLIRKIYLLSC